jgi:glycosyltransferase involved in cell wall biosynthesis
MEAKLQNYITKNIPKQFGLYSYPVLGNDVTQVEEVKNADIIYIHWVLNGFLNLHSLKKLAALKKPVIIFMHDMWSISGGCHYSFTCENYKTGCHSCQMFTESKMKGLPARSFQKKMKLYSAFDNFYFITPSKWLYNCAKESLLTKNKPVFYIPNLLDRTIFKPYNKMVAKRTLNIDINETVIAFGAVSVTSPYKGWSYLQQALQILKDSNEIPNITILIFGSGHNKKIADAIPFKTRFMGYLCDEYSTSLVYNATDVFIAPSLAEAFGYVVFESLNCGTPVVGFDIGGIPDMIQHKQNGYLAKYRDALDIAEGVKYCLQNNIKGYIPPELDTELTVNKHIELFEYIKNKTTSGA